MLTTRQFSRTATDSRLTIGLSRRAALRVAGGGLAGAVALRRTRPAVAAAKDPTHVPTAAEATLQQALVGTWVIEYVPSLAAEAATARLLTTFAADGSLRESLAPAWAAEGRRHGGVGQGLWTPVADGSFVYRSLTLRYDEDGWYQGEAILRGSFILDPTDGTLSGEFERRDLDADGFAVGFLAGAIQAVRADDRASADEVVPVEIGLPPQPGRPGEPY